MRGVRGRTRQGEAGIRGVQAGKQTSCLILQPRNTADCKLIAALGAAGADAE